MLTATVRWRDMVPTPKLAAVIALSISVMAVKPMLLHMTRSSGGVTPLPPAQFQLLTESLKVAIGASVVLGQKALGRPAPLWCGLRHTMAFMVPAVIYLLMNITVVRSGRLLQPPIMQLLANSKMPVTALVFWALQDQRITWMQWIAMALLTTGMTLGQWQPEVVGSSADGFVPGSVMMLLNSVLSAFGALATERLLKGKGSAGLSIFATNVHMAGHTILLNVLALHLSGQPVLLGLSSLRLVDCVALANEAANGILMSFLMRSLDSICKNTAFSVSVFLTAGLSRIAFGSKLPPLFFSGASLTLVAVFAYSYGGSLRRKPVKRA